MVNTGRGDLLFHVTEQWRAVFWKAHATSFFRHVLRWGAVLHSVAVGHGDLLIKTCTMLLYPLKQDRSQANMTKLTVQTLRFLIKKASSFSASDINAI